MSHNQGLVKSLCLENAANIFHLCIRSYSALSSLDILGLYNKDFYEIVLNIGHICPIGVTFWWSYCRKPAGWFNSPLSWWILGTSKLLWCVDRTSSFYPIHTQVALPFSGCRDFLSSHVRSQRGCWLSMLQTNKAFLRCGFVQSQEKMLCVRVKQRSQEEVISLSQPQMSPTHFRSPDTDCFISQSTVKSDS